MFETLKKLAGGSRPATSAELKGVLSSIDEETLVAALGAAEAERNEALLSGDEKRLERAESTLAAARRDLDRARAAREVLTTKIAETEQREAEEAIEAERVELEKLAKAVAVDLRKTYSRASKEIVDILDRLDEAERLIEAFNSRAAIEGHAMVDEVELRAFPLPHDIYVHGVRNVTSLQPVVGSPGWGSARVAFETAGIEPK